ncbi:hypothetical protein SAMN04487990_11744 [Bizionia paragorgiae]|uniref:Uncharacterized protein n=1 Tax=Bizionia paragorgiae TaxID=283786 RepID=A0A1H4C122_BIZPA|nr:hypothetical protein SAMN04487990_11744 [Bizionia paragorgiae]
MKEKALLKYILTLPTLVFLNNLYNKQFLILTFKLIPYIQSEHNGYIITFTQL